MTTRNHGSRPKAKLPAQQLAILAAARISEPMAYTSVFPYLPAMMKSFGIKQNKIARWVGITSGVFSVAQSCTAIAWGRASDTYGRKPTIVLGLMSSMICFVVWGMSTSLPMAIAVRAFQGGGNGNVGIIRTMVAEMVPEKELQPRAFSIMPLVWSLGTIIGPSFGGMFADPAQQYPAIFGDIDFFKRFPFALPNLILTVCFMISATIATLFLHETLPSKRHKPDWGVSLGKRLTKGFKRKEIDQRTGPTSRRRSFVDGEATAPLLPSKTMSRTSGQEDYSQKDHSVFTRQTVINLLSYTFLAFHSVAYDQVVPVFLEYPVTEKTPENFKPPFYFKGGFGLSTSEIGTIFTLYGIVCGVIQFVFYPPLVRRFGVLRCFRVCALIMPITYILTPYTVLFPTVTTRFAALLAIMFVKGAAIIIAFPSTTILLTNSCPDIRVLGTLNGFATTFSGIGRALGPMSTGAAFTWGVENGLGITAWFFLALVAAIGAIPVFSIVESDGPSNSPETSDDEEAESGPLLSNEEAVGDDSGNDSDDERSVASLRSGSMTGSYGTIKKSRRSR